MHFSFKLVDLIPRESIELNEKIAKMEKTDFTKFVSLKSINQTLYFSEYLRNKCNLLRSL